MTLTELLSRLKSLLDKKKISKINVEGCYVSEKNKTTTATVIYYIDNQTSNQSSFPFNLSNEQRRANLIAKANDNTVILDKIEHTDLCKIVLKALGLNLRLKKYDLSKKDEFLAISTITKLTVDLKEARVATILEILHENRNTFKLDNTKYVVSCLHDRYKLILSQSSPSIS